ncbi:hypothetical protein HOY82DRAFT_600312 [Tuber indicum]|nr:hypothetical protein HOY82DRAFT_600312 [Tuber indicum]
MNEQPSSSPSSSVLQSLVDDKTSAIWESKPTVSHKYVQMFKDWQSQKGPYNSPEGGEKDLTLKITRGDFLNFKKALNVDKDKSLPASITKNLKVYFVRDKKFTNFQGKYKWSEKTPDATLQVINTVGNEEVKFGLEVNFLETYDTLVEHAKMWLEGKKSLSTATLIKIEEAPHYTCPI